MKTFKRKKITFIVLIIGALAISVVGAYFINDYYTTIKLETFAKEEVSIFYGEQASTTGFISLQTFTNKDYNPTNNKQYKIISFFNKNLNDAELTATKLNFSLASATSTALSLKIEVFNYTSTPSMVQYDLNVNLSENIIKKVSLSINLQLPTKFLDNNSCIIKISTVNLSDAPSFSIFNCYLK